MVTVMNRSCKGVMMIQFPGPGICNLIEASISLIRSIRTLGVQGVNIIKVW